MVAARQHKLLLSLLSEKLHLQTASREQVENLFNTAYEYLERQRGSSPSLLQVSALAHNCSSMCDRDQTLSPVGCLSCAGAAMCRGCVGAMHCLAAKKHTGPAQQHPRRGWRAGSKHSLPATIRTA